MTPAIFIIDNDIYTKRILENDFLEEGYDVIYQKSYLSSVENCIEIDPSLVLLGMTLDSKLELTILQGIKISYPYIPVVIMMANATTELVKNTLSQGASDVILKPLSFSRVFDVVKRLARTHS